MFRKGEKNMNNETQTVTTGTRGMSRSVRYVTVTAMLAAVSFILQYIEISIPIMPAFIKFDFSDLPALLGSFAMGPVCGVLICLVKNVLHLAFSNSMFVGELSNFILGAVFVAVAGGIYKKKKTKTGALVGGIIGALVMGAFSLVSNYFLVYPVYYKVMPQEVILNMYQAILPSMKTIFQSLICFNLPFTIVKGLIAVVICMLIYKPLSPILKGKQE